MIKKISFKLSCIFAAALLTIGLFPANAAPPDTSVCDGQKGAAWGLCRAGVAIGCDVDSSQNGCTSVAEQFEKVAGSPPPWEIIRCGGIAGITCPDGLTCVDDPTDACDPDCGGADCGGVCVVVEAGNFCGGVAGIECPTGLTCVDFKIDFCSELCGGLDCGGLCAEGFPF